MKRGITTANAIIVAIIVIGSIFAINLFSSLSGVEDISGDITRVSVVGGFCGNKLVKTYYGTRTDVYTCPSGSSCVNNVCRAITTTPPPTTPPPTTSTTPPTMITCNTEKYIKSNIIPDSAKISGNRIVYIKFSNNVYNIYLYDLTTNTERLISSGGLWPSIDGDRIIYEKYKMGRGSLYLYDLTNNTERLISNGYDHSIDGDRIIYSRTEKKGNIYLSNTYLYDLTTNTERLISSGMSSLHIDGDRIVYSRSRRDASGNFYIYDIYLYDLTTNTERLISSGRLYPSIDGDRIVYMRYNVVNNLNVYALYLYTLC